MDPLAALRWRRCAPIQTPWLHEEVARRMGERLEWIKLQPKTWLHWDVLRSGVQVQASLMQRYQRAEVWCPVPSDAVGGYEQSLRSQFLPPWWSPRRWFGQSPHFTWPTDGCMEMVWANMLMHLCEDPQGLLHRWHSLLATDGFLMFSCLGPDTLIELRGLYRELSWTEPMHELTDMHDYGDMMVQTGFAEPVMDVERIVLTFATPERALSELRGLGRNFHVNRPISLLGRGHLRKLCAAMSERLRNEQGEIALTFEIIYGHAIKPQPRVKVSEYSSVSLQDMRQMLASSQSRSN
jgi:malonyl-CoA O-methyltransferase